MVVSLRLFSQDYLYSPKIQLGVALNGGIHWIQPPSLRSASMLLWEAAYSFPLVWSLPWGVWEEETALLYDLYCFALFWSMSHSPWGRRSRGICSGRASICLGRSPCSCLYHWVNFPSAMLLPLRHERIASRKGSWKIPGNTALLAIPRDLGRRSHWDGSRACSRFPCDRNRRDAPQVARTCKAICIQVDDLSWWHPLDIVADWS